MSQQTPSRHTDLPEKQMGKRRRAANLRTKIVAIVVSISMIVNVPMSALAATGGDLSVASGGSTQPATQVENVENSGGGTVDNGVDNPTGSPEGQGAVDNGDPQQGTEGGSVDNEADKEKSDNPDGDGVAGDTQDADGKDDSKAKEDEEESKGQDDDEKELTAQDSSMTLTAFSEADVTVDSASGMGVGTPASASVSVSDSSTTSSYTNYVFPYPPSDWHINGYYFDKWHIPTSVSGNSYDLSPGNSQQFGKDESPTGFGRWSMRLYKLNFYTPGSGAPDQGQSYDVSWGDGTDYKGTPSASFSDANVPLTFDGYMWDIGTVAWRTETGVNLVKDEGNSYYLSDLLNGAEDPQLDESNDALEVRAYPYYEATFDPGDGTGSMTPSMGKVEFDEVLYDFTANITLDSCTLTPPSGKVFDYWEYQTYDYDENTEIAVQCDDGATITVPYSVTLTAHWKDADGDLYDVTYNAGEGAFTGGDKIKVEPSQPASDSHTLKTTGAFEPTRPGYTFEGWSLDGSSPAISTVDISSGPATVYAVWTEQQATITYAVEGDGGRVTAYKTAGADSGSVADFTPVVTPDLGYKLLSATGTTNSYTVSGNSITPAKNGDIWQDDVVTVKFAVRDDVPYTIQEFDMNTDGSYPTTPTRTSTPSDGVFNASKTITAPSAPDHFTFDSSASNVLTQTIGLDSSGNPTAVFKVYYKRGRYTVTYTTTGKPSSSIESPSYASPGVADSYYYGQAVVERSAPTLTPSAGYVFSGWTWSTGSVPATMPDNNVTVTGTWSLAGYNVTYDPNGGAFPSGASTMEETGISPTSAYSLNRTSNFTPVKTNYDLAGWSESGNEPASWTVDLSGGNKTVKAVWQEKQATIQYSVSGLGGSVADSSKTDGVMSGSFGTTVSPTTGYEVDTVTGTVANQVYTASGNTISASRTNSALAWQDDTVTITFKPRTDVGYRVEIYEQDTSGAYPSSPTRTVTKTTGVNGDGTTGASKTISASGDYAASDSAGFSLDPANSTLTANIAGDGNTTFVVKYARNKFSLTYKTTGDIPSDESPAYGATGVTTTNVYYGATISPKAAPTTSITGYTFGGWASEPATMPAANTTVTGTWTAQTYTVVYDANGGTTSVTPSANPYKPGDIVSPALPTDGISISKANNKLTGWRTSSGTTYAGGASYTVNSADANASNVITLTAQWEPTYKLTYDLDGGAFSGSVTNPVTGLSNGSQTLTSAVPTKDGYRFVGWTATAGGSTTISSVTINNADVTVYAKWEPDTATISYTAGANGTVSTSSKTAGVSAAASEFAVTVTPNPGYEVDTITETTSTGQTASASGNTITPAMKSGASKWQDATFNVTFKKRTDIPSTIEIYVMDTSGNYPTVRDAAIAGPTGTLDTSKTIVASDWSGYGPTDGISYDGDYSGNRLTQTFTVDSAGNGTAVFKVYFKRAQKTVTYTTTGDRPSTENPNYASPGQTVTAYVGATVTVPSTPTVSSPENAGDFTFGGWRETSSTGAYSGSSSFTMPNDNVAIQGTWSAKTYKVTFSAGSADVTGITGADLVQNVSAGNSPDSPTNVTIASGAAKNWTGRWVLNGTAYDATTVESWVAGQAPFNADITLTPELGETFTITYSPNTPAVPAGIADPFSASTYTYTEIPSGTLSADGWVAPTSLDLSASGWTFKGWTWSGQSTATTTLPPAADKSYSFVAQWSGVAQNVTFGDGGGTWTSGDPSKTAASDTWHTGDKVTLPSSGDLTKNGYVLVGWTNGSDVYGSSDTTAVPSGATGYAGGESKPLGYTAGGNQTFTPVFAPVSYSVSITADSGATIDSNGTQTKTVADTVDAPTYTIKTGYEFVKWEYAIGGTAQADIAAVGGVGGQAVTGNTTFKMVTQPKTYNVTFTNTDGHAASVPAATTSPYNGVVTITDLTPADGYEFDHWVLTMSDEASTNYDAASLTSAAASSTQIKGDATFNAVFKQKTVAYKIEIYEQNTDGSYPATATQTVNGTALTGSEIDWSTAAPDSRTGFTRASTDVENNGTGADGSKYYVNGAGNTIVKVYFNRVKHSVTYSVSGDVPSGYSAPAGQTDVAFGADVTVAAAPTQDGYTFTGWTNSAGVGNTGTVQMPASDLAFTGVWAKATNTPYQVEIYEQNIADDNFAKVDTLSRTGTTDAAIPWQTVAPDTRTGFTRDDGATLGDTTIKADGTAVAKVYFNRNTYSVTYTQNGDVPSPAPTLPDNQASVKYDATVTLGAKPTAPGYTFTGWAVSPSSITATNAGDTFTMPDQNVTIGGTWSLSGDTPYRIEYYKETANNGQSGLTGTPLEAYTAIVDADTVNGSGTTGGTVPLIERAYPNYVYDHATVENPANPGDTADNAHIAAAGNTVVKVYYRLETRTVSYSVTAPGLVDGTDYTTPATATVKVGDNYTVASPLTATGHDFTGWNTTSSVATTGTIVMPAENVAYTGSFAKQSMTINYLKGTQGAFDEGIVGATSFTVQYGDSFPQYRGGGNPTGPSHNAGYRFKGWMSNGIIYGLSGTTDFPATVSASADYTAQWEEIGGKSVNYALDGGTAPDAWASYNGGTMNSVKWTDYAFGRDYVQPTKEGYTFSHWTDGNGNTINPATVKYSDLAGTDETTDVMVVTAHWTAEAATITFHAKDKADYTQTGANVVSGATVQLNPGTFTRDGYRLVGWDTTNADDGNGASVVYADGATNYLVNPGTDNNLYAVWQANSYKVHFEGNGATSGSMSDMNLTYGQTENLTANAFTKMGMRFDGWTGSDGKTYADGDSFTVPAATDGATLTLTAKWTTTRTVSYDLQGGTTTEAAGYFDSATVDHNASYTIQPTTAANTTKVGYTLTGWNTDADGKGDAYGLTGAIEHVTSDVTLYAQWEPSPTSYKVQRYVEKADESGYELLDTLTKDEYNNVAVKTGDSVAAEADDTPTGFKRNDNPAGAVAVTSIASISGNPEDLSTLVLYFDRESYKVTYVFAGDVPAGASLPAEATVKYGKSVTVAATPGAIEGYTFDASVGTENANGWKLDDTSAAGVTVSSEGKFDMPSHAVTLTGKWTINEYTVTYFAGPHGTVNDGSTEPPTEQVTYNTQPTMSGIIAAGDTNGDPKYYHVGWDEVSDASGTSVVATDVDPTSYRVKKDLYFRAHFEPTVAYTYKPGAHADSAFTQTGENSKNVGDSAKTLATLIPSAVDGNGDPKPAAGYKFTGWTVTKGSDGTTTEDVPTASLPTVLNDSYTFEAQWEALTYDLVISNATSDVTNSADGFERDGNNYKASSKIATDTANVTLPTASELKRPGYTLTGYTVTYNDGTAHTDPYSTDAVSFTMPAADVTATPVWSEDEVAVVYAINSAEGTLSNNGETLKVTMDDAAIVGATATPNVGYVFKEWVVDSGDNGASTVLSNDTVVPSRQSDGSFKPVTYRATFEKDEYELTVVSSDSNKGEASASETIKVKHGEKLTAEQIAKITNAPKGNYKKADDQWTFVMTPADGSAQVTGTKTNDALLMGITFTGPVTITAQYAGQDATVHFDGNGSTSGSEVGDMTGEFGKSIALPGGTVYARTGYTFDGWATLPGGEKAYDAGESFPLNATTLTDLQTTLYAYWAINKYTLTYSANGGSDAPEAIENIEHGTENVAITSDIPTAPAANKSFKEWNTKADGSGTKVEGTYAGPVTGDVTLYAIWQDKKVTLSFNANGGTGSVDSITKDYNATGQLPDSTGMTAPTGKKFKQWNTAANGSGTPYSARAPWTFTEDTELFAIWVDENEGKVFTVNYMQQDKTTPAEGYASKTVEFTETGLKPASDPVRNDFTFLGWSYSSAGGTETYLTDGTTFKDIAWQQVDKVGGTDWAEYNRPSVNTVNVWQVWRLDKVTVTFESNAPAGETATGTMGTQELTGTDRVSLSKNNYEVAGYTFAGWSTTPTSNAMYSDEQSVSMSEIGGVGENAKSEVTLYAKWIENTNYQVSYYSLYESPVDEASATKSTISVAYSTLLNGPVGGNPSVKPDDDTLTFAGWYTQPEDADGNAQGDMVGLGADSIKTLSKAGKIVVSGAGTAEDPGVVKLYAHYTNNGVIIHYDANGGTTEPSFVTRDAVGIPGSLTVQKSVGVVSKQGYTNNGWNTEADGSGTAYTDEQVLTYAEGDEPAEFTLYAQFEPIDYTVVYDPNYEGAATTSQSGFTFGSDNLLASAPTSLVRPGYASDGKWYDRPDGGNEVTAATLYSELVGGDDTKRSANVYLHWTIRSDNLLVVDPNGGKYDGSESTFGVPGVKFTDLVIAKLSGNGFDKNKLSRDGYKLVDLALDPDGNTLLTSGIKFSDLTRTVYNTDAYRGTVYAIWQENKAEIKFQLNDSSLGSLAPAGKTTQKIDANNGTVEPVTATAKTGYKIIGWNLVGADGSKTAVSSSTPGVTIVTAADGKTSTISLAKAGEQWADATYEANIVGEDATEYKVEHYKMTDDSTGYELAETQVLAGTTGATVTAPVKSYEGFVLNEWVAGTVKSGTIVANGDDKYPLTLKLYYDQAFAEDDDHVVINYKTDGHGGVTLGSETAEKTAAIGDLKGSTAVPNPGYRFNKWTDPEGNDVSGGGSAAFKPQTVATATYVANFAPNPMPVEFISGGHGSVSVSSRNINYDAVLGEADSNIQAELAMADNVRPANGYELTGWTYEVYDPEDFTTKLFEGQTDDPTTVTIKGKTVFKAVFEEISDFSVAYDLQGGESAAQFPTKTDVAWSDSIADEGLLPTTIPTKIGYTFSGWYLDETTVQAANSSSYTQFKDWAAIQTPDANRTITLYAGWTPTKYTVVYDGNGTTDTLPVAQLTNQEWNSKNFVTQGGTPTRDDYAFDGWTITKNGSDLITDDTTVGDIAGGSEPAEQTVKVYAKWREKTYTLHYDAAGGKIGDSSSVDVQVNWNATGLDSKVAEPTREGYVFDYWYYVDENNANQAVQATATTRFSAVGLAKNGITKAEVTEGTLLAHWTPIVEYTVVYNLQRYDEETGEFDPDTYVSFERKYKAPKGMTVSYNGPNAKVGVEGSDEYLYDSEGAAGYEWFNNPGPAPEGLDDQLLSGMLTDTPLKLSVYFKAVTGYRVEYNVNDDDEDTNPKHKATPQTIDPLTGRNWMTSGNLPEEPTRPGYTFGGWMADEDGTLIVKHDQRKQAQDTGHPVATENDSYGDLALQVEPQDKTITLYGKWVENEAEITYVTDDGTTDRGEITLNTAAKNWKETDEESLGAAMGKPVGATAKAKYSWKFVNWTVDRDDLHALSAASADGDEQLSAQAGGVVYSTNPTITPGVDDDEVYQKATYVANFEKAELYTVTYDANGGTNPPASKDEYEGWSIKAADQGNMGLEHKKFVGWNTKPDGTGTSYAPGAEVPISGDQTLYAQWVDATYTITIEGSDNPYVAGGTIEKPYGSYLTDGDVTIGDTTGYVLDGWTVYDENGKVIGTYKNLSDIKVTGNIKIKPNWKYADGGTSGYGSGSSAATGDTLMYLVLGAGALAVLSIAIMVLAKRRRKDEDEAEAK